MDVALISTIEQFEDERGRWETLERLDPNATVFTSWRWLRSYLPIARLRWSILVLRDGAEAQAYLPIGFGGSVFDREVYLAGHPYADYTGMIAHPMHEQAAVTRFAAALADQRWDAFNARDVRDPRLESIVHALSERGFRLTETDVAQCHSVALPATWEEYVTKKISAKTRVNTLRVERRLAEALPNFRISEANDSDIDVHVDAMVRLHHARWGGNVKSAHRRYGGLFRNAYARGVLRMFVYWDGEKPVAGGAVFVDDLQSSFGLYMIAFDEAYAKLSPGKGMVGLTIRAAIDSGFRRFDFLRGDEPFKHNYADEITITRHFRLAPPGLRTAVIATARPKLASLKIALGNALYRTRQAPEVMPSLAGGTTPRVLIAALDPSGLVARVPAMLAAGGCRTVALCPNDTSLAHSWMIERHIPVERDAAGVVAALRVAVEREPYDLVLIADEALLLALAERLEPWMSAVLPFAADAATCALVLDKNQMLRAIHARGIAVPAFLTVASAEELLEAATRIEYPLLLKDAVGCGGAGIRRVDAAEQLLPAYAELAPAGEITVQRFLDARPGCTDVVFDHGVPRCWTSAYMLGQWPTELHPATIRESTAPAGIEAMLRAVGSATQFHGIGGIDWLEDAGGLHFLEFNARPTHVVGPARATFGRELGAMVRGTPAAPLEVRLPRRAIPVFPSHFVRALKSRPLDLLQWLPFRASSVDLDWRDFGVVSDELRAIAAGAVRRLSGRRAITDDALTAMARRPRPYTG